MEDVYHKSTLAAVYGTSSDSDKEISPLKKKKGIKAPSTLSPLAKCSVVPKRIFIDSRDRNRVTFPSANRFTMNMVVPIRAVKYLVLTCAKIPIVANHSYVAVVLANFRDRVLLQTKESPGWPSGTLAIIPLVEHAVGCGYAYYQGVNDGSASDGWRFDIPQGLPQLTKLDIALYGWIWDPVLLQPVISFYPIPADAAIPNPPLPASNIFLQIECGYDVQ